jgi:gliding motility-associated-like protein
LKVKKKLSLVKLLTACIFQICSSIGNYAQNSITYNDQFNSYRVIAFQDTNELVFSTSNTVTVEKPYALYTPTAFSPDGDGINDYFSISGQGLLDAQVEVYNRWGQMVFKSYTLDQKWDGSFKGKAVPTGSYTYKIKTTSYGDNQKIVGSGIVSLVR